MRFEERDNQKRKYWISKWKNTYSIRELIVLVLIISPTLELLHQGGCGRSWWWRQYHQCVGDVPHTKHGTNCKAQIWQLLDVFYYLVSLDWFLCLAVQYNLWPMVIFWNKVKERVGKLFHDFLFILSAPTIALSISVLITDNANSNRLPLRPSMEDVSAIQ